MVQWTEKPAVKPQPAASAQAAAPAQAAAAKPATAPKQAGAAKPAAASKPEEAVAVAPAVAHRPVRKARKSSIAGPLQVVTVCAVFGLILGFFVYKEMPSASHAAAKREAAQDRDRDRDMATGRIVVMDHRAECREIGFDNQSGRTVHKGEIACLDQPTYDSKGNPSLYKHPTNRLDHIRRSFAQ
ncbi:MAG: hypothetical protein ACO1NY_16035 [Pseudorhodoplanes sp.]